MDTGVLPMGLFSHKEGLYWGTVDSLDAILRGGMRFATTLATSYCTLLQPLQKHASLLLVPSMDYSPNVSSRLCSTAECSYT